MRLELLRKEALRRRETPKYDNRCRNLSPEKIDEFLKKGVPYVIRFKMDELTDPFNDLVYGPVTPTNTEGDPVLLKTDGFPTYHLANVVDDHLMRVTHVLRGVNGRSPLPNTFCCTRHLDGLHLCLDIFH